MLTFLIASHGRLRRKKVLQYCSQEGEKNHLALPKPVSKGLFDSLVRRRFPHPRPAAAIHFPWNKRTLSPRKAEIGTPANTCKWLPNSSSSSPSTTQHQRHETTPVNRKKERNVSKFGGLSVCKCKSKIVVNSLVSVLKVTFTSSSCSCLFDVSLPSIYSFPPKDQTRKNGWKSFQAKEQRWPQTSSTN